MVFCRFWGSSLLQVPFDVVDGCDLTHLFSHTLFFMKLYIGVFSISGYAWATWRNRYKPFNPVLGETYEIHRKERGFRYVAEQVGVE